jgi:hypothetical protein
MKILSSLKSISKLAAVTTVVIASTALTNCGGGSDTPDATVRPQSLNRLKLTLTEGIILEFRRNAGSPQATESNVETGAVLFNGSQTISTLVSRSGKTTDIVWPISSQLITYTYTAVSDSIGKLQIQAAASTSSAIDLTGPTPSALQFVPFSESATASRTNFIVNFKTDGNTLLDILTTFSPESLATQFIYREWDFLTPGSFGTAAATMEDVTFTLTSTILDENNQPVPVNYKNNEGSSSVSTPGNIINTSLDFRTVNFVPDNGDPNFYSGLVNTGADTQPGQTEQGTATITDADTTIVFGTGTYEYDPVDSDDAADLTLGGGSNFDNRYRLYFKTIEQEDNGILTQQASGFYEIIGGPKDNETGYFFITIGN